jgi:D-ribulokinase
VSRQPPAVLGIDLGTSGVRCVAMIAGGEIAGQASVKLSEFGSDGRDPFVWWKATQAALDIILQQVPPDRIAALAVDGTSGTVLPVDAAGAPLAKALLYSDAVSDLGILELVARHAPFDSAARGPTSGIAKAMTFAALPGLSRVLHQADWIAGQLSGVFHFSDANNALKTGYDAAQEKWPDWIGATGFPVRLLPDVVVPGTPIATVSQETIKRFGFLTDTIAVAGTTDGCASFLATGADKTGEGVTALGTSLTIKLLSDGPLSAPQYGIYSHRVGDMWLAGGASNSGGKVLLKYFTPEQIASLSTEIDPDTDSGLDYYPLAGDGERFPIADPKLKPRIEPRPQDNGLFLKGLFEGIAMIEALGYQRLAELGGPRLTSVRTVGGGAANAVWSRIRARKLGVPLVPAKSGEAAAGTAQLALQGAQSAGLM